MKTEVSYDQPSKLSILLVEDNPIAQKVHRFMLERIGYSVDIAENGQQALAMSNNKHAMILMDINLPDMTGFEVTAEIRRRNKVRKEIPIVALTTYKIEDVKENCLTAGMDAVASKPIDIQDLQQMVYRWTGT
jgi:CheY-like chemotaxis protein